MERYALIEDDLWKNVELFSLKKKEKRKKVSINDNTLLLFQIHSKGHTRYGSDWSYVRHSASARRTSSGIEPCQMSFCSEVPEDEGFVMADVILVVSYQCESRWRSEIWVASDDQSLVIAS